MNSKFLMVLYVLLVSTVMQIKALPAGGPEKIVDKNNFDATVSPADNFFQYVNGNWVKNNPIPDAFPMWGGFLEIDNRNKAALHLICENAASQSNPRIGSPIQLVGEFYKSGMDSAAIEAVGLKYASKYIKQIDEIKTFQDVQKAIQMLHSYGVNVVFDFAPEQDLKDATKNIGGLSQAGISLPDKEYYFNSDKRSQTIQTEYIKHLGNLLVLLGDNENNAREVAARVFELEKRFASKSMSRPEMRDPYKLYHRMSYVEVRKLVPNFDWTSYFSSKGIDKVQDINVAQPEFFKEFNTMIAEVKIEDWKNYLKLKFVRSILGALPNKFVEEGFAFNAKVLSGTKQMLPRWRRVISNVDGNLGDALGILFVRKNFSAQAKEKVYNMVLNLKESFRERIKNLDWMSEATKAKAYEKLDKFMIKVGYPDKWENYEGIKISSASYLENIMEARKYNEQKSLKDLWANVDRTKWEMTAPTVNAYYNPAMNEIVFPAGILQSPFFDEKADDAINYGAIGSVIGHEMTHGFDDEGCKFDANGNLSEWWTAEDKDKFEKKSQILVDQFNNYVAIDTFHVNGAFTLGENIADLGGLSISFSAFTKTLNQNNSQKIDDFTPEQRFFISWAQAWRTNIRPETAMMYVRTDPHSPSKFRVNGPLSNIEAFLKAFNIPENSQMSRPKDKLAKIW